MLGILRLLNEAAGYRSTAHALNVCIIALLLGRAFGLGRDEMMDRSAHELGLWPDINEARRLAAAVAETGLVRDFRSAILVSGQWRDLLVSAATLEWEGEPATMLIVRDITERERARIEAEAILDHASVGIALTRGDRFERVNRHWLEIFGEREPLPSPSRSPT